MTRAQFQTLLAARDKDYLLYVEGYCENPACMTREVRITVKDYERDIEALNDITCPLCGSSLNLHHVLTRDAYAAR
jgi:hypothetical protein